LTSDLIIENSTLKALKADCVKHDVKDNCHNHYNNNDNNSNNDSLLSLSDLFHELRCRRAIEKGPLSQKQCIITEQLLDKSSVNSGLAMSDAEARIATLKPDNS